MYLSERRSASSAWVGWASGTDFDSVKYRYMGLQDRPTGQGVCDAAYDCASQEGKTSNKSQYKNVMACTCTCAVRWVGGQGTTSSDAALTLVTTNNSSTSNNRHASTRLPDRWAARAYQTISLPRLARLALLLAEPGQKKQLKLGRAIGPIGGCWAARTDWAGAVLGWPCWRCVILQRQPIDWGRGPLSRREFLPLSGRVCFFFSFFFSIWWRPLVWRLFFFTSVVRPWWCAGHAGLPSLYSCAGKWRGNAASRNEFWAVQGET